MPETDEEILEALAEEATALQPRLFAVYGLFREISDSTPTAPYLGWGMDFGPDTGALYWDPNDHSTHHSQSAEQILQFHQHIGTARLVWL
jgi:hypothetical protein